MKKFYKIFMTAVVFLFITSTIFISCSKEVEIKEPTKEEKEAGWRYFNSLTPTATMLMQTAVSEKKTRKPMKSYTKFICMNLLPMN